MAMRVVYTVVNGEILSENRGGVKRDYLPDPSGNTIALLDNTQTKTDTWVYWPYGEVKTRTGSNVSPFGWGGSFGCYTDNSIRVYVPSRYAEVTKGRWMTPDSSGIKSGGNLYGYARQNPVSGTDSTRFAATNSTVKVTSADPKSKCIIPGNECDAKFKGCTFLSSQPFPPLKCGESKGNTCCILEFKENITNWGPQPLCKFGQKCKYDFQVYEVVENATCEVPEFSSTPKCKRTPPKPPGKFE